MNPCERKRDEQPLRDALLEVQVHRLVAENAGVLEDDGADRRLAAPVGELLAGCSGRAQRVERRGPARIGRCPAIERRERPRLPAVAVARLCQRVGAEQLQRAGERVAKRRGLEADPPTRPFEQALAALDLLAQLVLAFACLLELLGGDPLALGVEVRGLDLAGKPLGVARVGCRRRAGARRRRR